MFMSSTILEHRMVLNKTLRTVRVAHTIRHLGWGLPLCHLSKTMRGSPNNARAVHPS